MALMFHDFQPTCRLRYVQEEVFLPNGDSSIVNILQQKWEAIDENCKPIYEWRDVHNEQNLIRELSYDSAPLSNEQLRSLVGQIEKNPKSAVSIKTDDGPVILLSECNHTVFQARDGKRCNKCGALVSLS